MAGDRISQALARISAAADRIGNAGVAAQSAASGDADLERRHAALRKEATLAIAQIDALIGQQSR